MAKHKYTNPYVFLVDHAEELVALKCVDMNESPFVETLTGDELKLTGELLMKSCQRAKSPHKCAPSVNNQLAKIKLLNGGSFGQNTAEQKRKASQKYYDDVYQNAKKQHLSKSKKAEIYCCKFASHIIFSDDKDHPLCESPPGPCNGIRTPSPLPVNGGIGRGAQ